MIQQFRNSNPMNALLVFLILVLLRLNFLFHLPPTFDLVLTDVLKRLLIHSNQVIFLTNYQNFLLSSLLIFVQAIILNLITNHHNIFPKNSWLPALCYVLVFSLLEDFMTLSVVLILNFFILYILNKLLQLYKQTSAISSLFDIGFLIAISSLLYPFSIWFIFWVWLCLLILRPFYWREWVSILFGFINVYILLAAYYFYHNQLSNFLSLLPQVLFYKPILKFNPAFWVFVPLCMTIFLGMVKLRSVLFQSFITVRKSFQIILFLFFTAITTFFMAPVLHIGQFLMLSIPLSVIMAVYFLQAQRKWIYESLFFIILASIIYVQMMY